MKNLKIGLLVCGTSLLVLGGVLGVVFASMSSAVAGGDVSEIEAVMQEPKIDCEFSQWVGLTAEEVEKSVKETKRMYRILKPGMPMTMDYRAERINVELDGQDKVVRVFCG